MTLFVGCRGVADPASQRHALHPLIGAEVSSSADELNRSNAHKPGLEKACRPLHQSDTSGDDGVGGPVWEGYCDWLGALTS